MKRFILCFLIASSITSLSGQSIQSLPKKKLIEFGHDRPTPAQLRDNLRAMEQHPFDGVMVQMPNDTGGGNVFDVRQWAGTASAARERELKILASLPKPTKFTHNFLSTYGACTMDWFSDEDWEKVVAHASYCAKAAKAAGFKGIMWDAEPYSGINPWRYAEQPQSKRHPFAEYERVVRQRGAQFMRALHDEFPGLVVLCLRALSDFQDGSPFSNHLLQLRDPAKQAARLENAWWGLHPAFFNGMLEAAAPDVTIVDANEDAYYYTSTLDFYRAYHTLRREALTLVAPELHQKYAAQVQVGHAVAVEYTAGRWAGLKAFPDELRLQGRELSAEDRARWFEHNIYYALATADEYVWVYSEEVNWWKGEGEPERFEQSLISARTKYEAGEPLGYDVKEMLEKVRAAIRQRTRPR